MPRAYCSRSHGFSPCLASRPRELCHRVSALASRLPPGRDKQDDEGTQGLRNWAAVQYGYNLCVSTDFLEHLASQLKVDKSAACRRAIQRILAVVKKNFEGGKYENNVEAEADFRQLVDRDDACK
jgi:hypothetical protein